MRKTTPLISVLMGLFIFSLAGGFPGERWLNALTAVNPALNLEEGTYQISIRGGDSWQRIAEFNFEKEYQAKRVDLPVGQRGNKIRIRISQQGGGAAHIDSLLLGGYPPIEIKGSEDALALKKVSRTDYDVIDAYNKTVEVVFPVKSNHFTFTIVARIEPRQVSKIPFHFPLENLYKPVTLNSKFYQAVLTQNPVSIEKSFPAAPPFFKVFSKSGTGHPDGYTYGWVKNDDKNLYVWIDFTGDNTMDGDKDYAKVYVKTAQGIKEFKVSERARTFGNPDFTYTDKVQYQHKVYYFTIPLKAIGVSKLAAAQSIELAFAAYGTLAPPVLQLFYPHLAFDPISVRYLAVYSKYDPSGSTGQDVMGQLVNYDGTPYRREIAIQNFLGDSMYPAVAYASHNRRYLVVWYEQIIGKIIGQFLNNNGDLWGSNFTITSTNQVAASSIHLGVAYDPANRRFLITWADSRNSGFMNPHIDIYGQLVNVNGSLYGDSANFMVSQINGSNYNPAVAYDSVNQKFAVVWQYNGAAWDLFSAAPDIYSQLVSPDGTLSGESVRISTDSWMSSTTEKFPAVAVDSGSQQYFVVWQQNNGSTSDVYGRLVSKEGAALGDAIYIANSIARMDLLPAVVYNPILGRYLVTWTGAVPVGPDLESRVYGQFIASDATLVGDSFSISLTSGECNDSWIAYNSVCSHFLTTFVSTPPARNREIGYEIVGAECAPNISVSPDPLDFGQVTIGTPKELAIKVQNTGYPGLTIDSVDTSSLLEPFTATENCIGVLLSGGKCTITVRFSPATAGTYSGSLTIVSLDPDEPSKTVNVSGTASSTALPGAVVLDAIPPVDDHALPFGTVSLNWPVKKSVTIINEQGDANLIVGALQSLTSPFAIADDTCSGKSLATGENCTFAVVFTPTGEGAFNSTFEIATNDPSNPLIPMSLSGTGTSELVPDIVVTDSVDPYFDQIVSFGNVPVGESGSATLTIGNEGKGALTLGTIGGAEEDLGPFLLASDLCSEKTLASGETCDITLTFTPTAEISYEAGLIIASNDPDEALVTVTLEGMGGAGQSNQPPTKPGLISPEDSQTDVAVPVTFKWNAATDPDGNPITYKLYYCSDPSFMGCAPVEIQEETATMGNTGDSSPATAATIRSVKESAPSVSWALGGGLFLVLLIFGGRGSRKYLGILLVAAMLAVSPVMLTCSDGNGGSSEDTGIPDSGDSGGSGVISYTASDLPAATTFYWKVVATDGLAQTSSDVWSFKTRSGPDFSE